MRITIVGGGNMGGAIAQGLAEGSYCNPQDITVITKSQVRDYGNGIQSVASDYSSLAEADIVILAIKPWLVLDFVEKYKDKLSNPEQLLVSVAAGIDLQEYKKILGTDKPIFRVMPNTAISIKQSMSFISSMNTTNQQDELILKLFDELGSAVLVDEAQFAAGTAISGCGIAFAFRYIRAAMEGGVEMGLGTQQSLDAVLQTLRGAVELLEANKSHPEQEIDKVTTPGGITIKGLNEMEHAGFTSAIIRGLKASCVK